MPWLQDTLAENVQGDWGATYRDVVILDPLNRPLEPPLNLTSNSLADPVIREQLKDRLRQAAVFVDSDSDGIGDDWEERFPSGASFLDYAFGNPPFACCPTVIGIEVVPVDGSTTVRISHRRRLGSAGGLKYRLQRKEDDHSWVDVSSNFTFVEAANPYDGTGTEVATFQAVMGSPGNSLLRVFVGSGDGISASNKAQ